MLVAVTYFWYVSLCLLEKKIFKCFLPYMGMGAILFNGVEPFKQIVNTLLTEGPMWNLVKIAQAVSEKKTFKNYTILYMYIARGKGRQPPRGKNLILTKTVLLLYTCIVSFSY